MSKKLKTLPNPILAVIFDFDGVFTDDMVYVFQDGSECVRCSREDGLGIARLKKTGLPIWIISTEKNPVVKARADKLGIDCIQGLDEKGDALRQLLRRLEIDPAQVIYVGNDINDQSCMELVGCAVAVSDANPTILEYADLVLSKPGGDGAIREICEMILENL